MRHGGVPVLGEIERRYGADVARIVADCTDAWSEPKPDWRRRKEAYLAKLPEKPGRSLLVSLADKTNNAEAILFDWRAMGDAVWPRFNGGPDGTRWYYSRLADFFSRAGNSSNGASRRRSWRARAHHFAVAR